MEKHYAEQKKNATVKFQVSLSDEGKISNKQFTFYDFIHNSFSFSHTNKVLASHVLEQLKKEPRTFLELQASSKAKKATLYLLLLSLERAGMVEHAGRNKPYKLSQKFSEALRSYALFWDSWRQMPE